MSNIGKILYGPDNSMFSRDAYTDKRIEAEGVDWIVARRSDFSDDKPAFAWFDTEKEKKEYIRKHSIKTNHEEET